MLSGGQIKMKWALNATFLAIRPTAVAGQGTAFATIAGHKIFARVTKPSEIAGGQDILQLAPQSCKRVYFDLGQGWVDSDLTGGGVFSSVSVSAIFSCAGN